MLETVIESLESKCYDNMMRVKKTTIGLGVEYDENSTCSVCGSVSDAVVVT